ncbi:MAG: hypothetical protein AB8B85_07435 [Paracoccaceae bacterium]
MRTHVLFVTSLTIASFFETLAFAQNEPFPGYDAKCGYRLIYAPTQTVSQAVIDRYGEEIIVLDPSLAHEQEAAQRTFLIAHECAHHRMDHAQDVSRKKRQRSAKVVRDQELSADCWAAETLAEIGEDRTIRIMADRFFKAGLYSPGGGYPAGMQRSTIVMHCAEKGRLARMRSKSPDASSPLK